MAAPALAKRPCSSPSSSASCREAKRLRPAAAPVAMERHDAAAAAEVAATTSQAQSQPLLPGLPDHLAQLCLSTLPPRLMHAVCRPWRRLLYAPSFPPFLSLYALLEDASDGGASFAAYDPIAARWDGLPAPPMPSPPPTLCHPSFLSRRLPLQSVAAAGKLVLVAGSTQSLHPALCRPLVFDPAAAPAPRWQVGPKVPLAPRRWCAAGAARGSVFVAGGVGAGYDLAVARSGATWDPARPSAPWEPLPPLRDGRFSRDAAEAVCSGGKVCMVNLRGSGAKEGAVFDLVAGRWEDMPPGMLAGWKGPAAASPDSGDTIFVVDEERGALNAYDWGSDRWTTVAEAGLLKGAAEMAAGGGRVCVVSHGGAKVVVVDVTPKARSRGSTTPAPPRMWEVEAPAGRRVVSLHVLPRMTRPE
ncbi:hypothetical protein ACQJBY_069782 [Aegilops geniculata]